MIICHADFIIDYIIILMVNGPATIVKVCIGEHADVAIGGHIIIVSLSPVKLLL